MRVTAGANAWRKVEVVMGDRRISHKLKGNVLSLSYIDALDIMALTEKQQEKEYCKKNHGN